MLTPSTNVYTNKGMHEYAMRLDRKSVSDALDRFYSTVNANRTNYRICGTRVERRGCTARFIVRYEVF